MTEFKTPTTKRYKSRVQDNPELQTPIKIPASPFLEQIGYGCGVSIFSLERSPRVGFARSPWAIKKRNQTIGDDIVFSERIRFEAEVLRKLNHPNIVGFRAFTEVANGEPCLAMEKLDISLGDKIEQRLVAGEDQFPAKDILKIAYEMLKGLEYLHHVAHILHGDIKSYNVLLSEDYNTVKLCDFGVSIPLTKSLEIDTSKGDFTYVGSDCWNAPEIINEDGPVTNKTDIWAYGLVIWEMLALSVPHTGNTYADDCSFKESMSKMELTNEMKTNEQDLSMDDSSLYYKCGTRPPLPAIDLGKEYENVLELFFTCTAFKYNLRPSARGILKYFQNYIYKENK